MKHFWAVRFSHAPLCTRFQESSVEIYGTHLCRSCLAVYSGILAAPPLLLADTRAYSSLLFVFLLGSVLNSFPNLHARRSRRQKDLGRFALGFSAALPLIFAFHGSLALALVSLCILVGSNLWLRRWRSARALRACDGCVELGSGSVCSGFTLHANLHRNFERDIARRNLQKYHQERNL